MTVVSAKWVRPEGATLALRAVSKSYGRDLAAAVNRTGRQVSTDVSQILREELTLKARVIKRGVRLRRRATATDASADIGISSRTTFLGDYQVRGTKRSGVSVRTSRNRGSKRNTKAFLLRFKSGQRAVAEPPPPGQIVRLKSGKRGNVLLYSASLAKIVQRPRIAAVLQRRVLARMLTNIQRQTRTSLRRRLGLRAGRVRRR